MKVAYGKDTPTSATDPDVGDAHQEIVRVRKVVAPGAYLVDSMPWLEYILWYGQDLKRGFKNSRRFYTRQLNRVKQRMVGIALVIFTSYLSRSTEEQHGRRPFFRHIYNRKSGFLWNNRDGAFLAGTLFTVGSTSVSLGVLFCCFRGHYD
jgi:hypothetical protein